MNFKAIIFFFNLFFISSLTFSQSLNIFLGKDLNFGDAFIGYDEEVLYDDERAAEFIIFHTSYSKRNLLISFDLPNNLTNGTDQLPIVFYRRHAAWSYDGSNTKRQFNPNYQLKRRRVNPFQVIYLWLGGKIKAYNSNLSSGSYTGTIILTVEYL